MLKDLGKRFIKKEEKKESLSDMIRNTLVDGFVDVKAYKENELIYHDAGDNVVTDWMRHAIMIMLTGDNFSKLGNTNGTSTDPVSAIDAVANHSEGTINRDGYILNGKQYFWNPDDYKGHYSQSDVSASNIFALFPTKVLLGTGKEYASWDDLENDTITNYPDKYQEFVNTFGLGNASLAKETFNGPTTGTVDNPLTINNPMNHYSSSLGNNIYSGSADIIKTRTVNDPYTSKVTNPSDTLNIEYGITGAIKTFYFDTTDPTNSTQNRIPEAVPDKGLMMPAKWRGVGRPSFIYFNTPEKDETSGRDESWADPETGAEIILTRDASKKYLEKITFTITMPEQNASNGYQDAFYPYNGFTLKQIGLFCDSRFSYTDKIATSETSDAYYQYRNMPCGIMLAKKHITPITKSSDIKVILTWIISI